jgi:hypothetical protein
MYNWWRQVHRAVFTSPNTLLRRLLPLDLALVHTGVAHGGGRCFGRCGNCGGSSLCWRCKGFGDRACWAVRDLVDVAGCEDIAEAAAARLDNDVGRALEVKEELFKVSEILHKKQLSTHPITPNGLASPSPQCERSVTGESPHSRLPHGLPETCVWQQIRGIRDLESQKVRLEPVGCGCMLLHAVCDQVAGVYDVLLASLEGDLVDLAFATQSEKTTASSVSVTPVSNALSPSACVHPIAI